MKERFISACGRMKLETLNALRVGAVFFILIELFFAVVSCCYFHRLTGESQMAEGVITEAKHIPVGRRDQYCIYINGEKYEIDHYYYSRRSFGIPENMTWAEFLDTIDSCIGEYSRIEYISLTPESRKIIRFTVGSTLLVSKADALQDYKGMQQLACIISSMMLIATVSGCMTVRYGIRLAKEKG